MELLLILLIVLLLILLGGMGYLLWILTKPKLETPTPEKVFDDFKKMYDESDPRAKERLEQMSKCIFYSSESTDKVNTYGK